MLHKSAVSIALPKFSPLAMKQIARYAMSPFTSIELNLDTPSKVAIVNITVCYVEFGKFSHNHHYLDFMLVDLSTTFTRNELLW